MLRLDLCLLLLWLDPAHLATHTASESRCTGFTAAELAGNGSTLARHAGASPRAWKAAACPLEMIANSCYWHNPSRAQAIETKPLTTDCRPFSRTMFWRYVACRTLVF
eukprot:EG_transcript_50550